MQTKGLIRTSMDSVAQLRCRISADAQWAEGLQFIKRFQSRRFAGSYADLLEQPIFAPAARFFLEELYGAIDFAERDAQFAWIGPALERMKPAALAGVAGSIARLHALSEELDASLGSLAASLPTDWTDARRYAVAWHRMGRRSDREYQLSSIVGLGHELVRLTRMSGLRQLLRLMRAPAAAAGLGSLQVFLESGFEIFGALAKHPGMAEQFLDLIAARESALLDVLFSHDVVASETVLARTLGQARDWR